MTDPAVPDVPDVDAVAAALRADVVDLEIYVRVLSTTLADALPPSAVQVERDRSLSDRLAGRDGTARAVHVVLGDWQLDLIAPRARNGMPEARVAQRVRGVVISSKQVDVEEWVQQLARLLAEQAERSGAARAALGRLLGQG